MRLKLRTKIRGGLLLVFVISMSIGIYAATAVARITNYIARMEDLTHATTQASDMVMAHHIWISRITEAFMFGTDFGGGLDPTLCIWGVWRYGGEIYAMDDPVIRDLIYYIDYPHARMHVEGGEALRLRAAGMYDEAFALIQDVVLPYGYISTTNITALSNRYQELWSEVRESLRLVGGEVMTTVIIIFSIALLAFFALSYYIPKSILKPVNRLVALVSDVTSGKVNYNRAEDTVDDEIGRLTNDTYAMADVIRNMVDDLAVMKNEFIVSGNFEHRVDAGKYQNSFGDMIEGIHDIIEDQLNAIMTLLDGLNSIKDGDFNVTIRDLPGKKMILPETLRAVLSNIRGVTEEIGNMIDAAVRGDLNFKTDEEAYSGDWKKIMIGLNEIAKAVDLPLKTLVIAMGEMKVGNFDLSVIEKKIEEGGYNSDSSNYQGAFKDIVTAFDETCTEISSYVQEVTEDLEAISKGDLTTEITRKFMGSFSAIKRSLNLISSSLRKTMSDISVASDQVLSGANLISGSANELANGAQQQASSVQQLNATIDMINHQTRQNAQSALSANNISSKSAINAKEGNDAMKQTVAAMTQIKESSDNISKIIKTIQDIAFQTNLLALNASVEAARAGEHGKGFAVVAEEVRNLAGRSQEAANETTTLIQDSINRVETGSSIAATTSKSLDAIVSSAGEVSGIISGISTASQEQAEAIGQISEGLAQISKVTQGNSAASEETAAAAQELNSQAELLQQLVKFFKL